MVASQTANTPFTINTRGCFRIIDSQGHDHTPMNRKERAVFAILAVSDKHRCSRLWLQSLLWSESCASKASANLRRALSNIRSAFAGFAAPLSASKHEVWLTSAVVVAASARWPTSAELLELVDAPDPAFDEWLRDLRAGDAESLRYADRQQSHQTDYNLSPRPDTTLVIIESVTEAGSTAGRFFEEVIRNSLADAFRIEGATCIILESGEDLYNQQYSEIIRIETHSTSMGGDWLTQIRALIEPGRQFNWSGRHRQSLRGQTVHDGIDLHAFAVKAASRICTRYHSVRRSKSSPSMAIHRAAMRLFEVDLQPLQLAEDDLRELSCGEGAGLALAWRSFALIARRFEYGDDVAVEEAETLAREAVHALPDNAVVSALASRVALDMSGDQDLAEHHARRALLNGENDPYALLAMARVSLMSHRTNEAARWATSARQVAKDLPHSFVWDFEVCLTCLATGDFHAAHEAVQQAVRSNARRRASLRYLVATSLLIGDKMEAARAAARLAALEPGFTSSDLGRSDYPVATLRMLGLSEALERRQDVMSLTIA